jgi:hypothetical protein
LNNCCSKNLLANQWSPTFSEGLVGLDLSIKWVPSFSTKKDFGSVIFHNTNIMSLVIFLVKTNGKTSNFSCLY